MALRDIRRRIKSIRSTQQITGAMKLIASTRLPKAQIQVNKARPYARAMLNGFQEILERTDLKDNPFFTEQGEGLVIYIVVTSDRGLTGGFNTNILRVVLENAQNKEALFFPIGRKGRDYLHFRGYQVIENGITTSDRVDGAVSFRIASRMVEAYKKGEYREVYLAYSRFNSATSQTPKIYRLLPFSLPLEGDPKGSSTSFEFEPSIDELLESWIIRYLSSQIYRAMVENKAGEYASRMMAMDNATKNAEDMIRALTLELNQERQAAITQEISEIVGGAEALK
jgi:F-type H+-transporting ATPase subunit gamma